MASAARGRWPGVAPVSSHPAFSKVSPEPADDRLRRETKNAVSLLHRDGTAFHHM